MLDWHDHNGVAKSPAVPAWKTDCLLFFVGTAKRTFSRYCPKTATSLPPLDGLSRQTTRRQDGRQKLCWSREVYALPRIEHRLKPLSCPPCARHTLARCFRYARSDRVH